MQSTPRHQRQQVLIVIHGDNYLEVFGEKTTQVKIVRCPQSFNDDMAILAENYVEEELPPFWRKLYFPGKLRAAENVRPLLPSTVRHAKFTKALIEALGNVKRLSKAEVA